MGSEMCIRDRFKTEGEDVSSEGKMNAEAIAGDEIKEDSPSEDPIAEASNSYVERSSVRGSGDESSLLYHGAEGEEGNTSLVDDALANGTEQEIDN